MNYKIINKQVFEQAQLRSVSDVPFTEEELQSGMKLAVSKADETLTLYLVDVDGQKKFEVRWMIHLKFSTAGILLGIIFVGA